MRYLVQTLYGLFKSKPEIDQNGYRNMLNEPRSSRNLSETRNHLVEVNNDGAEEMFVARYYKLVNEARIEVNVGSGPFLEDGRGMQLSRRAFLVKNGLFRQQAPDEQLIGRRESQIDSRRRGGNSIVKYRYLKTDSIAAEMGAFTLLHPYGNRNASYDSAVYFAAREVS